METALKTRQDRLAVIATRTLESGAHSNFLHGMCVMERSPKGTPLRQRLSRLLLTEGECLVYMGARTSQGYGCMSVAGKTMKAHRVAWELDHGPIPDGLCVLHRCDNPSCCRVGHLFLGTVLENNRDRSIKGRSKGVFRSGDAHPSKTRLGEGHWSARLSASDVVEIRRRRKTGESTVAIGALFGVHPSTISRIARGVWRSEVSL